MQDTSPLIIERTYNAPSEVVWQAITDNEQMKHWYFPLEEFHAVVGFEFQFSGGSKEKTYLHLCRVTEVIPGKKLAYTWKYDGYPGESLVSIELFPEGDKTHVKLTHTGLETFPQDPKDFARTSFEAGWTSIIGTNLKNYVEQQ